MIIDLAAYLSGLLMPLECLLGVLGSWFPNLRFSLDEYIERSGGRDPKRRHWKESFGLAVMTWFGMAFYFFVVLYKDHFALFIAVAAIVFSLVSLAILSKLRDRRITHEIQALDLERIALYATLARSVDASERPGGHVEFNPKVDTAINKLTELDARIERLNAQLGARNSK